MPSSDPITIPQTIMLIRELRPKRLLDVGCGNGRYGLLFRECLDMSWGRMKPDTWDVIIDGVEIVKDYHNPVHDYFYTGVFWDDWLKVDLGRRWKYDVIFMGDVLEHFEDGVWEVALQRAMDIGHVVVVVAPNWEGSIAQGPVFGNESETHRTVLTPAKIGGKCVWANTKAFITIHSEANLEIARGLLI